MVLNPSRGMRQGFGRAASKTRLRRRQCDSPPLPLARLERGTRVSCCCDGRSADGTPRTNVSPRASWPAWRTRERRPGERTLPSTNTGALAARAAFINGMRAVSGFMWQLPIPSPGLAESSDSPVAPPVRFHWSLPAPSQARVIQVCRRRGMAQTTGNLDRSKSPEAQLRRRRRKLSRCAAKMLRRARGFCGG